jgi:hypothetical protein
MGYRNLAHMGLRPRTLTRGKAPFLNRTAAAIVPRQRRRMGRNRTGPQPGHGPDILWRVGDVGTEGQRGVPDPAGIVEEAAAIIDGAVTGNGATASRLGSGLGRGPCAMTSD